MKQQKDIFKVFEGDNWFKRNNNGNKHLAGNRIVKILKELSIIPGKILEIGCSNGALLEEIRNNFGSEAYGIDPSALAIQDGIAQYKHESIARYRRCSCF